MIIGNEAMGVSEDATVRLHIAFNPHTFELSITNDNAKNCAQVQMILDEAVRMYADTRRELIAQAQLKQMQEQMLLQNVMAAGRRTQ